jgi:type IV secretory pathway VirB3-like protein
VDAGAFYPEVNVKRRRGCSYFRFINLNFEMFEVRLRVTFRLAISMISLSRVGSTVSILSCAEYYAQARMLFIRWSARPPSALIMVQRSLLVLPRCGMIAAIIRSSLCHEIVAMIFYLVRDLLALKESSQVFVHLCRFDHFTSACRDYDRYGARCIAWTSH